MTQEKDSCITQKRCLRQGGGNDSRQPCLSKPQFSFFLGLFSYQKSMLFMTTAGHKQKARLSGQWGNTITLLLGPGGASRDNKSAKGKALH